jgi:hypothetical protein
MAQSQCAHLVLSIPAPLLVLSLVLLSGCSPAEVQAVTSDITTALNDLEKNKSLSEQFVRESKKNVVTGDSQYEDIIESYERAREKYNNYLSQIEETARTGQPASLESERFEAVKASAREFIATAARGIDPNYRVRAIDLNTAIMLSPKLVSVRKLPLPVRTAIADRIAADLHWKSWSEL